MVANEGGCPHMKRIREESERGQEKFSTGKEWLYNLDRKNPQKVGSRQCKAQAVQGRENDEPDRELQRGEQLWGVSSEGEVGRGTVGVHGAVAAVAAVHREGERCDAKRARTEIGLRRGILSAEGGSGYGRRSRVNVESRGIEQFIKSK